MAINTIIATNVLALTAHRNLGSVGKSQSKASERLSSGKKINSAADDAAGLAISQKMKAQIRGLDMATKNSEDAISLIQTAEGSISEMQSILQRIRELSVQAANDTNTEEERIKMANEMIELIDEIDSMSTRTEFNGQKLVDGNFTGNFQIGANSGQKISIEMTAINSSTLCLATDLEASLALQQSVVGTRVITEDGTVIGGAGHNVTIDANGNITETKPTDVIQVLEPGGIKVIEGGVLFDDAGNGKTVYSLIAKINESMDTGTYTYYPEANYIFNDIKSKINNVLKDPNIDSTVAESFEALKAQVDICIELNKAAFSGTPDTHKAEFDALKSGLEELYKAYEATFEVVNNQVASIAELEKTLNAFTSGKINSLDYNAFSGFLNVIDDALSQISDIRAKLGASQNRLEYTNSNLQVSSENLSSANSRIEDADMAKEMMELTKANVLQQAAISMLAQANQAPNNITQLLG